MKDDAIYGYAFDHDHALRAAVCHYIRRYNRARMHSSLGYRSPIDCERIVA
jgi:transposase InsO family protein